MGEWMDSKNEIKVGDYVAYISDRTIVVDDDGNPLRVVKIDLSTWLPIVRYTNGEFDWLETVERAPSLLLELV